MHLGVYERGHTALLLCRLSLLLGLASAACGSAKDRSYVDDTETTDSGGSGGTTTDDDALSTGETSNGGTGATNDASGTTGDASGGNGTGGSAGGQGGDTDASTHGGGASGSPGTDTTSPDTTTDTSTTGAVVDPPFVPGPAGMDVVAGGSVVTSPRFTLVMSVGQSPGGNARLESSRFSLASGLVGTMR